MKLDFTLLNGIYSIYRLNNDSAIPGWICKSEFYSVTRTKDELSVVCLHVDEIIADNIKIDSYWRILKINGPLDLSLTGIIAGIAGLMMENKIPVFTVSTYDTDYILVKDQNIDKVLTVLENDGHKIFNE
jgi:hypothetical protein